uniref:Uncharacterized protein n=1 Tax=Aegilops tauschii subsp. strangulata TaxID=200361 RepID=A0A453N5E7_AEGTS
MFHLFLVIRQDIVLIIRTQILIKDNKRKGHLQDGNLAANITSETNQKAGRNKK